MPSVNDYVNYSIQGICLVEDIRRAKFGYDGCEREYYVLRPVHQENSHVFVPTDNLALVGKMRPVLSPEEIDSTILSVRNRSIPWVRDRKKRTAEFHEILSRRDERELLLLVSCLYLKSKEEGKGLSDADGRVLKEAQTIIEREFSFSLNIEPQKTGEYIRGKLGISEDSDI